MKHSISDAFDRLWFTTGCYTPWAGGGMNMEITGHEVDRVVKAIVKAQKHCSTLTNDAAIRHIAIVAIETVRRPDADQGKVKR